MTLDEGHLNQRELMRRDRERDRAAAKAAWDEERLRESVESVEAHWVGAFRQGAGHWSSRQHWGTHG